MTAAASSGDAVECGLGPAEQGEYGKKLNNLTRFAASSTPHDAPCGDFSAATVTHDPATMHCGQGDTVAMGNLLPELMGPVQLELAVEQLPGPQACRAAE